MNTEFLVSLGESLKNKFYNTNNSISNKTRVFRIILSFFLLSFGGMIYILFRQDSLQMFTFFDKMGIKPLIQAIRILGTDFKVVDWVKYNLPDGLWLFSYMFLIDAMWNGESAFLYYFFLYLLPIIAITSEILQLFNVIPGVYDTFDLLFYFSAIILFLTLKFILK